MITGVESFELADVRGSLARDFDLLLASRFDADLFGFLEMLQRTCISGYRHCGFPDATVEVSLDYVASRIELRVKEGPRYHCGEITITGLPQELEERVRRALTDKSSKSKTLWTAETPARFDDEAESRLRDDIQQELARAGFFHADFKVTVTRQPETKTAALTLAFASAGPRATLGLIEITGAKRDSQADILKYLDLHEGAPYDSGMAFRLEQRLSDSGRYRKHRVRETHCEHSATGDSHAVSIELEECDEAPPLAAEFSPLQQALLKLRDWIGRWSEGKTGYDLVIAGSTTVRKDELLGSWAREVVDLAGKSPEFQIQLRCTIDPDHGDTVALTASRPGQMPIFDVLFEATGERFVLASPSRKGALVLPNSGKWRSGFEIKGRLAEKAKPGGSLVLNAGLVWKTPKAGAPPFGVQATFAPAFMVAALEGAPFVNRNGICELSDPELGIEIRIDSTDGRLIELKSESGRHNLTMRTERGAFAAESGRLDALIDAPKIVYDAASPWKSVLELLLDEATEAIRREGHEADVETLAALRKLIGNWQPPAPGDLFADCGPEVDDGFWIPSHRATLSFPEVITPNTRACKYMTGMALWVYRRLVPKTGWMWPAGRDAALYWASGDSGAGWGLWNAVSAPETGPAGELLLAGLGDLVNLALTEKSRRAGLELLSAAAFARDYRPLLTGDSWLGRWTVSLLEATRALDEHELASLARLIPNAAPREAIVQSLLQLRGERQLAETLPAAFDGLWNALFRASIELALERLVTPATSLGSETSQEIQRASAEQIAVPGPALLDNGLADEEDVDSASPAPKRPALLPIPQPESEIPPVPEVEE